MSEWLNAQAPARPAGPGLAGAVGIPNPIQPLHPLSRPDVLPFRPGGADPASPAASALGARGPVRSVAHPGLSDTLRARIEREFMPRWTQEWGGRFFAEGRVPGPQSIRLDGNDYLSVAGHPDIVTAQIEALHHHAGFTVQSSVFLRPDSPVQQFESDMAEWVGVPHVVLCQSGYAANLGLLQVIAEPDMPVYVDTLAHMSLWEGIRAARARPRPFRHNQPAHLARCIREHGPGVVVVDAVYSTVGALCPLREIVEVAEQGGCMIVVDESHSLGTHGPQGRGLCAELDLTHRVHFITASLAKAFAGRAGFFTVPDELRYLSRGAFPNVFSSCLLPYEVVGLQATLALIRDADGARSRLHQLSRRLRSHLIDLGYPVAQGTEQIIALEVGREVDTLVVRDALEALDVFGAMFCAPATSKEGALVRLTLSAGLTDVEVQRFEDALTQLAPTLRPWEWPAARRQRRRAEGHKPHGHGLECPPLVEGPATLRAPVGALLPLDCSTTQSAPELIESL